MNPIEAFCRQNGLPEAVAVCWRAQGVAGWTPLQEAAWGAGVQRGEEHWLIAGPTSAGKGLLAEAAAACCLARGRKVLWLAPTRALAAAAARQLAEGLAPLGARVRCATRDSTAEDAQIFRNQFDVLVAVYEKAAAWNARQPHGLAQVGLVVTDELATLRDPERGGRLDVLLTLIQASPYGPRRLGLTTPAVNLGELAGWWGGRLLESHERPRPLREGVLNLETGQWRWRDRRIVAQASCLPSSIEPSTPSISENEEPLATPVEVKRWVRRAGRELDDAGWPPLRTATAAVAAALAARGEPTLLFASSRAQARAWAAGLAEAFALPTPPAAWVARARALAASEPAWDHHLLARALERGVGVHHADLSASGRRLAEEAFREGAIRLLVATPTLAQGVNLAAANVIHWPERPEIGAAGDGGPRAVALEGWRFADQGGRAGRLGQGEGPGRSILVAWDARGAEALWRRYIVEQAEPVTSGLAGGALAPALLACLTGDVARTRENLRVFFAGTFAGATVWRARPAELDQKLERAFEVCRAGHLVGESERGLRLTGSGQICAAAGLDPDTAARLESWLDEMRNAEFLGARTPSSAASAQETNDAVSGVRVAGHRFSSAELAPHSPPAATPSSSPAAPHSALRNPQSTERTRASALPEEPPLAALCALALCAPAGWWPGGARPGRSPVAGELRRWFAERETAMPEPLAAVLDRAGGPLAGELAALEAAWRLGQWIGPEPTEQVERRTGWPAGTLARAGEGLAWVAAGAAALTLARGGAPEAAREWRVLGERLAAGAPPTGAALAAMRVDGLGRHAIQALCAVDLVSAQTLAEAPMNVLRECVGDKTLARRLRAAARKMRNEECGMRNENLGARTPSSASPYTPVNSAPETKDAVSGVRVAGHRFSSAELAPHSPSAATPSPSPGNPQSEIRNPQSNGGADEGVRAPRVPQSEIRNPQSTERTGTSALPGADLPSIEIDLQSPGVVRVAGREVRLTPLSFDLLAALAEAPGRVLTRQAIYQRLWPEGGPEDQQLDAHRRRLAGELSPALDMPPPRLIETIRGVGFRLNLPALRVQLMRG